MFAIYQVIRNSQSKFYLYSKMLTTVMVLALLLSFTYEQDAFAYRLMLLILILSVFAMLFWGLIFSNRPFNRTTGKILSIIDVILVFGIIYPLGSANVLFIVLPALLLTSFLIVFVDIDLRIILISFFVVFSIASVLYGILGFFEKPLLTFIAHGLLYALIMANALMTLQTINDLEHKQNLIEEDKRTLELKSKNLMRELQVSQQQSDLLHRDVRKKDIEIKNIITLSGQLSVREDSRKVLTSFLLTAIGQIGSGYAAILTRQQKDNNFIDVFIEKGLRGFNLSKVRIYLDSNLIQILNSIRDPIMVHQIPRDGLYADEAKLLDDFAKDLICPLFIRENLAGMIIIGKKVSGAAFTQEDVNLVSIVAHQTSFVLEQTQLTQEYREFYSKTLRAMIHAIEVKYIYTRGHNVRTAKYVNMLVHKIGLPNQQISDLSYGALLHDIGKIAVQDKYLLDQSIFSGDNSQFKNKILDHTIEGSKILKAAGFNQTIVDMALHHHEYFDGKGYPHRLGNSDISIGSRILSICNVYDAMISDRPYRKALSPADAKENLRVQAGHQFDPDLVNAFLSELEAKEKLRRYH